jgi:SAM-dependent methyltransferase
MADTAGYDTATLDFYAAEAPVYAASGPGGTSRHLAGFLALLPPGARILELGCGGGRDAEAMIAAGFDVDATDGSPALAAEAERRLGRPVRIMRFDELAADQAYDAVWAAACLLHVARAGLPGVLARIHRALKPSGLHFASYKASGAEGRDRFGRLFNQLTATELTRYYIEAGPWEIVARQDYVGTGYDGEQTPWVAITARRA